MEATILNHIDTYLHSKIEVILKEVIKASLNELESHLIKLLQPKIDFYAKFNNKVHCLDFEALLSQLMIFKEQAETTCKGILQIFQSFNSTAKEFSNNGLKEVVESEYKQIKTIKESIDLKGNMFPLNERLIQKVEEMYINTQNGIQSIEKLISAEYSRICKENTHLQETRNILYKENKELETKLMEYKNIMARKNPSPIINLVSLESKIPQIPLTKKLNQSANNSKPVLKRAIVSHERNRKNLWNNTITSLELSLDEIKKSKGVNELCRLPKKTVLNRYQKFTNG